MPKPDALSTHLCALIVELTRHRKGRGPHWIAVSTIERELKRHDISITLDDLQAAIAICVARHVMKAEGDPPHSIAVWQKEWEV